ncbi:hypothetical protein PUNSTDRAFT_27034, partial [Punctularia strigosozonata HHB-11173 SS5]
ALDAPPPEWTAAPEKSHADGLYNEASDADYEAAEQFCSDHPPDPPRLLPSHTIDRIAAVGCAAWGLDWPNNKRFVGRISNSSEAKGGQAVTRVETEDACGDTCLLSDFPITAGLYDTRGKAGVYFEVTIDWMDANGVIAVGTSSRPYPSWRLPGWNRLSAGLHLDDCRKFFEDPDGGRDYTPLLAPGQVRPGDVVGCGLVFPTSTSTSLSSDAGPRTSAIFYTYNGMRLPDAFKGVYLPRGAHDVYAAIGVSGRTALSVNFGGETFRWKEGNEWAWRVEGHVGQLAAGPSADEELPTYSQAR